MLWLAVRFLVAMGSIAGLLYWAKRRIGGAGGGAGVRRVPGLRVVARVGVAKGATVVRVAVGDKDLLLGCTQHEVTNLAELPPSPEPVPVDRPAIMVSSVLDAGARWSRSAMRRAGREPAPVLDKIPGDVSFATILRDSWKAVSGKR
jgi:hypothetical protein